MVTLVSAHGSPGVTTTALVLAATWPEPRSCLLVEADPFGAVIAARFGLGDTPGLSTLAAQTRGGFGDAAVEAHIQRLPGGLPVLVGPPSPEEAQAVWRDVAVPLAEWAAGGSLDVIVDRGRILPGVPPSGAASENDVVLVVARPTVDQLRSASLRQTALVAAGFEVSLLLIGDRPYGPDEVSTTMRVPVTGMVAWDPKTAAALAGMSGAVRDLRRSPLVRSAATLAEQLAMKPEPDRVEPSSVAVSELAEGVGG
jgi:MinD-like ATPase involved in chromosome partitioning or flagellar assembly